MLKIRELNYNIYKVTSNYKLIWVTSNLNKIFKE